MSSDSQLTALLSRWEALRGQGRTVTAEELCQACPELQNKLTVLMTERLADAASAAPGGEIDAPPSKMGRYAVRDRLGAGGFGAVYRGFDEELQRWVAIKIPHPGRFATSEGLQEFLREAREVAQLDHPNILTVHDAGEADGRGYIVYKLIDGVNLHERSRAATPTHIEAALLVAQVADALDYAHRKGLYHRDIKPSNILIDRQGTAFIVDFGLEIRESELPNLKKPQAGTLPYMSPEQLRGEGHRIDGRTDIYSLGVVLYELLCGQRPFEGKSKEDLADQILHREVKPPRQVKEAVPRELERICLKAMSKRVTDRYTTARDLGEELRLSVASAAVAGSGSRTAPQASSAAPAPASARESSRDSFSELPLRVIPKGLRSFGPEDSDFFLELVPGPRDREGLPGFIRFWKTQIETPDANATFSVGLMYGPSGCGKTSLVKAGLLPRLSRLITPVYVEATRDDTETRIARLLRKACPWLPRDLTVAQSVAALRHSEALGDGRKVLIVLDQFEQWLHAQGDQDGDQEEADLVLALRQCDGEHVQCIVMVRDDFWVAITRFMHHLEVRLVEGQNLGLVDLFDPIHARKVLTAFGRAFGRLPEQPGKVSSEERRFLDQAVAALAQNGEVYPVRLSLFAEMLKGKPWTPSTLKAVGGIEGLGVTFLEETFSARTANPEHHLHEKAARSVLKALLPEHGVEIKGLTKSHQELLAASGYASRPRQFAQLMDILDTELRLVTPADPEGNAGDSADASSAAGASERVYQLAHDYLVPSVRQWLTAKQKETRRGRAELRLEEWAAQWQARPVPRNLPGLWQWSNILCCTSSQGRSEAGRKMLHAATRRHVVRGLIALALVVTLVCTGLYIRSRMTESERASQAAELVKRLLDADMPQVPGIIAELDAYRRWASPRLREVSVDPAASARQRLIAQLALLSDDPGLARPLREALIRAGPQELAVIRQTLMPHADALKGDLWELLLNPRLNPSQRFRAACALAAFDPHNPNWERAGEEVAIQLVSENPILVGDWMNILQPVHVRLFAPLKAIYLDRSQPEPSYVAALVLAEYAADQPNLLCQLLELAENRQIGAITARLKAQAGHATPLLKAKLATQLPSDATEEVKEDFARQRSNAAVALLTLAQDDVVWPLFRHTSDPRVRTYLIHKLAAGEVESHAPIARLKKENDDSVRRALLMSLGEYGRYQLTPSVQEQLEPLLLELYSNDPDAGIHSAVEWLLRKWNRSGKLAAIDAALVSQEPRDGRRWYINSQGFTMAVVPEPDAAIYKLVANARQDDPPLRPFAIATKEVTVEQFGRFQREHGNNAEFSPESTCPMNSVDLEAAMRFCQWLSEQEEIPEEQWCYEEDSLSGKLVLKKHGQLCTGYRLPTYIESEIACRAGAVTSRFFGETESLLGQYAHYGENSGRRSWPVGRLKPNDLGLFDSMGNIAERCDGSAGPPELPRIVRGGSFLNTARDVKSGFRVLAMVSTSYIGLRVARTCP